MSSKLVRKGLELLNGEKRKGKTSTSKSRSLKTAKASRASHVARQTKRGFTDHIASEKKCQKKGLDTQQEIDFTEFNMKYFKSVDWKVNRDVYEKVVQHQTERRWRKKAKTEETGKTGSDLEEFDVQLE